jgi:hypothetical protein
MEHQSPVAGECRLFQPLDPFDRLTYFDESIAATLFGGFHGGSMESPRRLVSGLRDTAMSCQWGQSLDPTFHDAFDYLLLPVSLGEGHQQMHLGGEIPGIEARGWHSHLKFPAVDRLHGALSFPALAIEDHKTVASGQAQDADRVVGLLAFQENLTRAMLPMGSVEARERHPDVSRIEVLTCPLRKRDRLGRLAFDPTIPSIGL